MADEPVDTSNDFLLSVGPGPDRFGFFRPPHVMTRAQALRAAAWIVALADPLDEDFPAVLAAIRST